MSTISTVWSVGNHLFLSNRAETEQRMIWCLVAFNYVSFTLPTGDGEY